MADRLRGEHPNEPAAQIRRGLALVTSRPATDAEERAGLALIRTLTTRDQLAPDRALDYFCLMLLNLNEFIYLD
jgi:hypothetical protein